MERFDVIIVGAGIAGASCAYHLTQTGVEDILVLEAEQPASKASGRAAGFLTTYQFLSSGEAYDINEYCTSFYENFARDSDDIPLHYRDAYTLARTEKGSQRLTEIHQNTPIDSKLLTGDELGERVPELITDDVELAFMYPDGMFTDPHIATNAILNRAREKGATLRLEEVTDLSAEDSPRVITDENEYEASNVVLATGAWSTKLTPHLGEQIPLKPRISQIAMIRPESEVDLPLVNDPDLRIYYRSELDGDVLVGGGNDNIELNPDTFSPVAKESFLHDIAEKVPKVFRSLANSPVSSKWSGLCSATPDRHPLVGEMDAKGFYLCCGFNGEGIMFSPAAGRIITDLIVDRETPFNRGKWDPYRFDQVTDFEIKSAIDW